MLTKMKKNPKKSKKKKFLKKMKKTSGHMAQGKPQLNFERNPCCNFRDNRCDRRTDDGRQTTDEFRFHELCWHSLAELKISIIRKMSECRAKLSEIWASGVSVQCTQGTLDTSVIKVFLGSFGAFLIFEKPVSRKRLVIEWNGVKIGVGSEYSVYTG